MPVRIKSLSSVGYTEREISDAVNQLGQFGSEGTNVLGGDDGFGNPSKSFTVPANHFESTGAFRINDSDVKAGSLVIIDATNTAAIIATVGVSTVGDGFFEVNDPPPELMFAVTQVQQVDGVIPGGLSGGVVLPFDVIGIQENFDVSIPLDRITSKIIGIIQLNISISGLYATGRDYEFGITKFNISDVLQGTFTLKTSTSNQNDTVSVGGSIIDPDALVGDYYVPLGSATGANTQFDYDMTLTAQTITPVRGVIVNQEVTYNYAVIQ